jgi:hypothetical protein
MVRRVLVSLGVLGVGALALWLSPVSAAALVPRTLTSWLIVGGIVLAIVLWSRLVVPRLSTRTGVQTVLRLVPVVALLAVVVVPASVDREVSEDLLAGIPTPPSSGADPVGRSGSGGSSTDAPPADGPSTDAPAEPPAPAEPQRLSGGEIMGVGHVATGEAVVYRSGTTTFVRLQGIDIQGAVDVFVYLVPEAEQTEPDGGVNLGALKGTRGDANYVVPADVDVADYRTVLLWCRAFATPIAVAVQA